MALKILQITVKHGTRLRLKEEEGFVTAEIPVGESNRVIIGSPDSDKLVVGNDMSEGKFQARLLDKKRQADEMDTQTVITAEGRPASIYITQSIPIMEVRSIGLGNQISKIESIHYKVLSTVLMVLPRLNGDQVTLEISPQKIEIKRAVHSNLRN
mgnify:CR=1 FL=1